MGTGRVKGTIRWLATIGAVAVPLYAFAIRPWHLKWGATEAEAGATLPGDELLPNPRLNATHAVTIEAPASAVWPWLVQIGQGRGGFYAYDWLENLFGLNIHSADRVVPEYQNLQVGDVISVMPGGKGPKVAILDPNRALVLYTGIVNTATMEEVEPGGPMPRSYFSTVWAFILEEVDEETTRLVERFRSTWNPTLSNTLFYRVMLEPAAFLMERKMLLGIKERAENAFRRGGRS